MTETPRLTTERLTLRSLRGTDRPFIGKLISNADVRRFLGGPVPITRRDAVMDSYFSGNDDDRVWLVETQALRQPIGLIFLSRHCDSEQIELSYQFHPDAWGFGYATEAAGRVVVFARYELHIERLVAETQSANAGSRRLLERLGMKEIRRVERFGAEQSIYSN